jgi:tRNA (guanine-N7-)-methyltransferase
VRQNQRHALQILLPKLTLDLDEAVPEDITNLFSSTVSDLKLEIGFGGGEHLMSEAKRLPSEGFIGCERYATGMAKFLKRLEEEQIGNARVFLGNAVDLLQWLPDASLSGVDLLFPDPWPKRKHLKRRFVSPENMIQLARLIKPGGQFRFATDVPDYAAWTFKSVGTHEKFRTTARSLDDCREPWEEFTGTRYQARAVEAGRPCWFMEFRRR